MSTVNPEPRPIDAEAQAQIDATQEGEAVDYRNERHEDFKAVMDRLSKTLPKRQGADDDRLYNYATEWMVARGVKRSEITLFTRLS
jgi:hypothetical protein